MSRRVRVDPQALRQQLSIPDDVDPRSPHFLRFVIRLSEALDVDIPEAHRSSLATLKGCLEYVSAVA